MRSAEEAVQYLNLLARSASVADAMSLEAKTLPCAEDYDKVHAIVEKLLIPAWRSNPNNILPVLEDIVSQIETMDGLMKRQYAEVVCKWMAANICFDTCMDNAAFSLSALFDSMRYEQISEITSMNTNYDETGISIIPQFPARGTYWAPESGKESRRLYNRDIFDGLNGELENLKLMRWNPEITVRHILLSPPVLPDHVFRCAFSPLSSKDDIISIEHSIITRAGTNFNGITPKVEKHEEELRHAFQAQWYRAAEAGAHLFFAPEMVCTETLAEEENGYNKMVRSLSKAAQRDGLSVPLLTVMPSYWRNGINSVTVLFQDGRILGRQRKRFPFQDKKNHQIEALIEQPEHEILLIHLPDAHRIAILLCSDMLTDLRRYAQEIICGQLGTTLIISPSYSEGEQDFINALSSFKPYGTSVLWGNCCGGAAAKSPRAIGGISIAGLDSVERFGNICQCGGVCKSDASCLFVADLPLQLKRDLSWKSNLRQLL